MNQKETLSPFVGTVDGIFCSRSLCCTLASLCSEKPLYKYATKKYKCSDEVALYEGNSVTSAATEGM